MPLGAVPVDAVLSAIVTAANAADDEIVSCGLIDPGDDKVPNCATVPSRRSGPSKFQVIPDCEPAVKLPVLVAGFVATANVYSRSFDAVVVIDPLVNVVTAVPDPFPLHTSNAFTLLNSATDVCAFVTPVAQVTVIFLVPVVAPIL